MSENRYLHKTTSLWRCQILFRYSVITLKGKSFLISLFISKQWYCCLGTYQFRTVGSNAF